MVATALAKPKQLWEVLPNGRLEVNPHRGQWKAWKSRARFILVLAGSQGGKTSWGPLWLYREIKECGPGDYLCVTSSFPLLKLKMLPEFLKFFQWTMGLGEWRASDRVFEFHGGKTRVIFGTASHPESLESATAKGAWLDECVAPETTIATEHGQIPIRELVQRRALIRVWSYDVRASRWELRPIVRWIRLHQRRPLIRLGILRLTGNHKIWTAERGYLESSEIRSAWYTNGYAERIHLLTLRAVPGYSPRRRAEAVLQPALRGAMAFDKSRVFGESVGASPGIFLRSSPPAGNVRTADNSLCRSCEASMGSTGRREDGPFVDGTSGPFGAHPLVPTLATGRERTSSKLATGAIGHRSRECLDKRACRSDRRRLAPPFLQDRHSRDHVEDRDRSWERCESAQAGMVCAAWLDLSALLESDGRDLDDGLSSDGYVYNLEVAGNHNYVADGVLVANCGQDDFKLQSWEAVQRRMTLNEGRVLMTTTPYSLGWLKQQVYDRWRAGDRDYDVVQFASIENPVFPRSEYDRLRQTMPFWKFSMFIQGIFSRPAGLIYSDFIDAYREEGGHKVHPFDIPPVWPRWGGFDFGGVNTARLMITQDPASRVYYLYNEYHDGGKTSAEHAAAALEIVRGTNIVGWWGGSGSEGQQRRDFKAGGVDVQVPPLHQKKALQIGDGTNDQGIVEAGIDRVIEIFKTMELYVFDSCAGVLDELGTYARELDPVTLEPTEKIKDKASFHRLDALRYLVDGMKRPRGGIWFA